MAHSAREATAVAPEPEAAGTVRAPSAAFALLPAAAALAIGMVPLFWFGHWTGVVSYDEGAYVGSAIELAHGLAPYRDFVMVQPPGITVLLFPVSAFARLVGWGSQDVLAICRVLTVVVTACCAGLVALALRHRGVAAMLVGGGALAAYPLGYTVFSTTILEPYLDLFCLIGVVLLFRGGELRGGRHAYLAGLAFGLAASFKIWALLPAGIAFLACLVVERRRGLFVGSGVVTGLAVVYGPFAALAPRLFFREVFLAQVNRLQLDGLGARRIAQLSGIRYIGLPLWTGWLFLAAWLGLVALAHWRRRDSGAAAGRALDRFAAVVAVVILALLLLANPFYSHYSFIAAPWIVLVLGSLVGRVLAPVSLDGARRTPDAGSALHRQRRGAVLPAALRALTALTIAGAAVLAVVVPMRAFHTARSGDSARRNAAALAAIERLPPTACIETDQVSFLVSANHLSFDPAQCPIVIDSYGVRLVSISEHGAAATDRVLPATWQAILSHADAVYLSNRYRHRIPWSRGLNHFVREHFAPLRLARTPAPLGRVLVRR